MLAIHRCSAFYDCYSPQTMGDIMDKYIILMAQVFGNYVSSMLGKDICHLCSTSNVKRTGF